MDPLYAGVLRLYGLKSLEEATDDNWPWWFAQCPRMPYEPAEVVLVIEKMRESGYEGHWDAQGYSIYDQDLSCIAGDRATMTEAVRDALRFIGEERG